MVLSVLRGLRTIPWIRAISWPLCDLDQTFIGTRAVRCLDPAELSALRCACVVLRNWIVVQVSPAVWPHVLFPLGNMRKETVRQLAYQSGLHVAAKKSSTGLCFVGKRRFGDFVGQYLEDRPGGIRSVEGGNVSVYIIRPLATSGRLTDLRMRL